jgi:hypothetical protein
MGMDGVVSPWLAIIFWDGFTMASQAYHDFTKVMLTMVKPSSPSSHHGKTILTTPKP